MHPYIFLHIPELKFLKWACTMNLEFFGGTCQKTKVGACVKTTFWGHNFFLKCTYLRTYLTLFFLLLLIFRKA